jgi:hypothetical protein
MSKPEAKTRPRPLAEAICLAAAGVAIFAAGRWVAEGEAAASVLQIIGGAAIFLAPLLQRLEGKISVGAGGISITLREGRRAEAVLAAVSASEDHVEAIVQVAKAPHRALASILPLLSGEVACDVIAIPDWRAGSRLDQELQFVRKELDLSVVALKEPGVGEWLAGGRVTTSPLKVGTQMLVCGPPSSLEELRRRLAATA